MGHIVTITRTMPETGWSIVYWRDAQRTPWTVQLDSWHREAKAAECVEIVRLNRHHLEMLSLALRYTLVGETIAKQRSLASMNERYVYKNGKRVYVGKKAIEAKKAKIAAAARDRRTRERDKSHGVNSDTLIKNSQ